ncbi:hypothetical protein WMO40_12900 [Bacillaceae bacterium CLA-AA-H227]|uniref:Uncharacterized protein n=1 Tax=Robertmurraya yapensis (ex Hitch et al 2024) TaxID=3133160 RepID=A0ACC6SCK1_9BACI
MKYSHWELLLKIYQYQQSYVRALEVQVNKNLIRTCYKNGWVEKLDDDTLIVTEKGIEASKEIAPLYEKSYRQVGQTF